MKNPFFEVITTNIWPAGRQPFSEWAVTRAKRLAEEENQKESQRDRRVRKRDERTRVNELRRKSDNANMPVAQYQLENLIGSNDCRRFIVATKFHKYFYLYFRKHYLNRERVSRDLKSGYTNACHLIALPDGTFSSHSRFDSERISFKDERRGYVGKIENNVRFVETNWNNKFCKVEIQWTFYFLKLYSTDATFRW